MRCAVHLRGVLQAVVCLWLSAGLWRCTVESAPTPDKEVTAQWGGRRDLGAACASERDCYSNQCVDGVCCDSACEGACEACDVAGQEGTCSVLARGTACNDGNTCTVQDACNGQSADGCSQASPAAGGTACGTGTVCNGASACLAGCWIGGAYRAPGALNPASPCQRCDPSQSTSAWSPMPVGTVCAPEAVSAWGACGGFSGTCGEAGTQSRTVTTYACLQGACQPSPTVSTQSCSRDTDGTVCGGPSYGSWGACSFPDACSLTGTQVRTVSYAACASATCSPASYPESQGCSRSAPGSGCGGGGTDCSSYNFASYRGQTGLQIPCSCNSVVEGGGSVWGTDYYTDDSNACRAAVHAGAIPASGGDVTVTIEPGRSSYTASTRNGITTSSWTAWDGSFSVRSRVALTPCASYSFGSYRGQNGLRIRCSCPSGNTGSIWGTDLYTDDSHACTAAVHAGALTQAGGNVTVVIRPGQSSYASTQRYGITSYAYGDWSGSIALTP
jgi:hypothetical protein